MPEIGLPLEPWVTLVRPKSTLLELVWAVDGGTRRVGPIGAFNKRKDWLKVMANQSTNLFMNGGLVNQWHSWVQANPIRATTLAGWFRWTLVRLLEPIRTSRGEEKTSVATPDECGLVCGANQNGMLILHYPTRTEIAGQFTTHTYRNGVNETKTILAFNMGFVRVYPEQVKRLRF